MKLLQKFDTTFFETQCTLLYIFVDVGRISEDFVILIYR